MSKPTARQVWQQLVDEAGEEEIARVLAMSVKEVDAELEGYGFDLAAEDAKAEKFLHDLVYGRIDVGAAASGENAVAHEQPASAVVAIAQPPPPVLAERRRRPRTALVLLFAATAAAVGGGAMYAAMHQGPAPAPPSPQPPVPAPSPSSTVPGPIETAPPDMISAADWRKKAVAACDAEQWGECLSDLDQARELDPSGDTAPLVKKTRERAIAGIRKSQEKPTP